MTQHRMLQGGVLLVLLVAVVVVAIQWYRNAAPSPPRLEVAHPAPMETAAETSTPAAAAPSPTSASDDEGSYADPPADAALGTAAPVMVHVVGAVRRPGVYRLPRKARLTDAVKAAGGVKAGADLEAVNMASFVQDGEQIRVPTLAERRALRIASAPRSSGLRTLPQQPQPRPVRSTARYPLAAAAAASATASAPAGSGRAAPAAAGIVNVNTATAEELDTLPGVGPSTAAAILDFRKEHGPFQRVQDLLDVRGIGEKKLAAMRNRVTVK